MERQMTIDDYLNRDDIVMIDESQQPSELAVTKVEYNNLTKEDLLKVLKQKDTALENYESKMNEMSESHSKEMKDMEEYYRAKLGEMSNLIQYYERKFKVLNDILNIETGGTK